MENLEIKVLGALLGDEYHSDDPSPQCYDLFRRYIAVTDSVKDRDIIFIKALTKMGAKLLERGNPCIDSIAEKLYNFNIEGMVVADWRMANNTGGYSVHKINTMKAHMAAHAAKTAKYLSEMMVGDGYADKKARVLWANRRYDCLINAAECSPHDERERYVFYSFAGDAAWALYAITGLHRWKKRSVSCFRKYRQFLQRPGSKSPLNSFELRICDHKIKQMKRQSGPKDAQTAGRRKKSMIGPEPGGCLPEQGL